VGLQVVQQRFTFLRKAQFHKIQKLRFVDVRELGAFAGQTQSEQRGVHFRRRAERAAGNVQHEFGPREVLCQDGKIAVVARAGLGGEAQRDLVLDDNVNLVNELRIGEQVMQDRRRDVIGQVAVNPDAPPLAEHGDVRIENVRGNNLKICEAFFEAAHASGQLRVKFDGENTHAAGSEMLGHFAVAGADFDPAEIVVFSRRCGRDGLRGNSNGARDFFAPAGIGEEVLS